ncbi:hypothetical protein XENOCAPTIV_028949 [Xenoophorus captivus]|uniref:Uncharacterized protein n=1 Tax=Xenoophorus captivus TaxID=1517983 RepID=A0ABV0RVK1_9TELE
MFPLKKYIHECSSLGVPLFTVCRLKVFLRLQWDAGTLGDILKIHKDASAAKVIGENSTALLVGQWLNTVEPKLPGNPGYKRLKDSYSFSLPWLDTASCLQQYFGLALNNY